VTWSEPIEPVPTTPPPGPVSYGSGALDGLAGDEGGRRWWLAVLLGLLMVGLGLWMLANLVESVVVLAVIIGVSLITGGLVDAFVLGSPDRPRWAGLIEGLLLVGAGIVVLSWPEITLWALAIAGGLSLVLGGLVHLVMAVVHRHDPDGVLDFGLGVMGLVLGGIVLAWPEATLVVLAVLFGIRAILVGALAIGAGWQMRRRHAVEVAGAAG
jgi:uncharacterized membrane protein HdeD (DUF308 family)